MYTPDVICEKMSYDKGQITQPFPRASHEGRIFLCDVCFRTFESGRKLRRHKTSHTNKLLKAHQELIRKTTMRTKPDKLLKLVKLDSFKMLRGMLQNSLKSKLYSLFYSQSKGNNLDRNVDIPKVVSLKIEQKMTRIALAHANDEISKIYKFCCAECGKRYRTKHGLRIHLNGHFGIKAYKCPTCGLRFSQKGGLTAHMRIHTGEKPFVCEICNMRFTQPVSREHMSKHTGERLHKCDLCYAEFGSKTVLKTHKIAKHTFLRPFQCDICKKTFADKHYMTKHKTMHRPVRPYPCTKCEKSFITKSNLRRHIEIHTGRSSHVCTVCSKSYNNGGSLLYHMTTHSEERKFICGICSQQLASKQNLEKHMTLHARNEQDKKARDKNTHAQTRKEKQQITSSIQRRPNATKMCSKETRQKSIQKFLVKGNIEK